ncbi:hypothetical protein L7F22_063112 [Adiantum nelumboides]|nr:hypothetical protein [Adiantum nelumboides]
MARWARPCEQDPCRQGVHEAVRECQAAGMVVGMIKGDNLASAKAIAIECNILQSAIAIKGATFQNYSDKMRKQELPKIAFMARSLPIDKLLMVHSLKKLGEVVVVTRDGTNNAHALHKADIGLSMGIQGIEVAKESSNIIILNNNFASVVNVVVALTINFIAAVLAGGVPLKAIQLLWVNLIMDTLGALVLATKPPTNDVLLRPLVGKKEPLVSLIGGYVEHGHILEALKLADLMQRHGISLNAVTYLCGMKACTSLEGKGSKTRASMKCIGYQGSRMKVSIRQLGPGDIVCVLQLKERAKFKRKGDDLFVEHTLNLKEAPWGFQFVIVHLDGRKLLIKSAPGEIVKPDFPESGSLSPNQCKAVEAILPLKPLSEMTNMELGECNETILQNVNMEEEMNRKQQHQQSQEVQEDQQEARRSRRTKKSPGGVLRKNGIGPYDQQQNDISGQEEDNSKNVWTKLAGKHPGGKPDMNSRKQGKPRKGSQDQVKRGQDQVGKRPRLEKEKIKPRRATVGEGQDQAKRGQDQVGKRSRSGNNSIRPRRAKAREAQELTKNAMVTTKFRFSSLSFLKKEQRGTRMAFLLDGQNMLSRSLGPLKVRSPRKEKCREKAALNLKTKIKVIYRARRQTVQKNSGPNKGNLSFQIFARIPPYASVQEKGEEC